MDFRRICVSLISMAGLFCSASAYEYKVGGTGFWSPQLSVEYYNRWAERMRFQVTDTIEFTYESPDSVLRVAWPDYRACNTSGPIETVQGNIFRFAASGPFYFISGNQSACSRGERMVVVVMAIRNLNRPRLPISPSPSVSSPAPERSRVSSPAAQPTAPVESPLSPHRSAPHPLAPAQIFPPAPQPTEPVASPASPFPPAASPAVSPAPGTPEPLVDAPSSAPSSAGSSKSAPAPPEPLVDAPSSAPSSAGSSKSAPAPQIRSEVSVGSPGASTPTGAGSGTSNGVMSFRGKTVSLVAAAAAVIVLLA